MIYDITAFGAKPESGKLQTDAIQRAADHCHDSGGGTVNIPPGTFPTGTIRLYSNTILHLEPGAVLQGPDSFDGYPGIPFGWDLYPSTHSLIYAMDAENISITGGGTIDFNGKVFVDWHNLCTGLPEDKQSQLTPKLRESCHYTMPPRDKRPNRLIFFHNCRNVELSGISLQDAPTWGVVFSSCRQVRVCNVNIANHLQVPNSDGIHCCGCSDVVITGCVITAGDDCIAITGIADASRISERIIISDCILRSASAAVRIGFQAGKIRNVMLHHLIIHDSNRGIAVFAGKGGWIEDLALIDLQLATRIYAGPWWGKGEPLVICASDGGRINGVFAGNITARAENSIVISGGENITLKDWNITLSYGAARPLYGTHLDLSPHPGRLATDATKAIPWLNAENAVNLVTENISVRKAADETHNFDIAPVIK
jgi:polygalacturonase